MAGLEPATCRLRIELNVPIYFVFNVSFSAAFGMLWAWCGLKLATHPATRFRVNTSTKIVESCFLDRKSRHPFCCMQLKRKSLKEEQSFGPGVAV
jgi:hypothetical protein